MTETLIKDIQQLVANLAGQVSELSVEASSQITDLNVAVNDIASHTLAMEAILISLLKSANVDKAEVMAWIDEQTAEFAEQESEGTITKDIAARLLGK